MPTYGLWMLVVFNLEVLILFALRFHGPVIGCARAAVSSGSGSADREGRQRPPGAQSR